MKDRTPEWHLARAEKLIQKSAGRDVNGAQRYAQRALAHTQIASLKLHLAGAEHPEVVRQGETA